MNVAASHDRDAFLENLAAELTNAAYPIVLRHGVGPKWLDLELDLWRAMSETVARLGQDEAQHAAALRTPSKRSDVFG